MIRTAERAAYIISVCHTTKPEFLLLMSCFLTFVLFRDLIEMDSKSGYPHPEQQQQQFPDNQQQNLYPNVPPMNPPSYEQTVPQPVTATVMQSKSRQTWFERKMINLIMMLVFLIFYRDRWIRSDQIMDQRFSVSIL